TGPDGQPRYRGSGKDLMYFDDQTRRRYYPHVIEPSAGADRATLAFLCEAYCEDTAPDQHGKPADRVVLKLHPRLAPIKGAGFPWPCLDRVPYSQRGCWVPGSPGLRKGAPCCGFLVRGRSCVTVSLAAN